MKKHSDAKQIRPPPWMSKPERRSFLAVIGERSAGNRQLSAEEVDTLADYVSARSRLAALQRMWRQELRGGTAFRSKQDHLLKITRQIDATVAACRRLAKAVAMPSGDHRKKGGARVKGARVDDKATLANGAGLSPTGLGAAR